MWIRYLRIRVLWRNEDIASTVSLKVVCSHMDQKSVGFWSKSEQKNGISGVSGVSGDSRASGDSKFRSFKNSEISERLKKLGYQTLLAQQHKTFR